MRAINTALIRHWRKLARSKIHIQCYCAPAQHMPCSAKSLLQMSHNVAANVFDFILLRFAHGKELRKGLNCLLRRKEPLDKLFPCDILVFPCFSFSAVCNSYLQKHQSFL